MQINKNYNFIILLSKLIIFANNYMQTKPNKIKILN